MGLRSFLYICLTLLIPLGVPSAHGSMTSTSSDMLKQVLSVLPESDTKRGLKEYSEAIGLDNYYEVDTDRFVGKSNAGIAGYFENRIGDSKNSCVRDAAKNFYNDIAAYLNKRTPAQADVQPKYSSKEPEIISSPHYNIATKSDRAMLNEVAGSGRYANYEPGWVWNLAMKHANGDPNSALFLIGICGHDDMNQGNYNYEDKSEASMRELRGRANDYLDKIKKGEKQLATLKANPLDTEEYENVVSTANREVTVAKIYYKELTEMKSATGQLTCPLWGSGFYAARSLGESADIPVELKNELLDTFSDDGAKKVSSKYYHIYGSAFLACQFVQNGISPSLASQMQQQVARAYRGIRMCEGNKDFLEESEKLQKLEAKLMTKYKAKDPANLMFKIIQDKKMAKNCASNEYFKYPECKIGQILQIPASVNDENGEFTISEEDVRKKIKGRLTQMDAARLYEHWYLGGGTIAGQSLPCSDVRVLGPTNLRKPTDSFFGRISKPAGWTDERYLSASKKVASWDADYKWTIAEHKAGAEFAGKVCKKRGPGEKPLKGICPNGPPDGKAEGSGANMNGSDNSNAPRAGVR